MHKQCIEQQEQQEQRDDALLLCEHEPDVATEAERATPDYWRERYNQAAAYARRLREYLRNWQQVAVDQEGRAVVAEAEVADYHDLHLPAASEGIVCVARRWRDLTLEAEQRNAEILQRAELAEARLAALTEVARCEGNRWSVGKYISGRACLQLLHGLGQYATAEAAADAIIAAQEERN
jgi:hypothetical protein